MSEAPPVIRSGEQAMNFPSSQLPGKLQLLSDFHDRVGGSIDSFSKQERTLLLDLGIVHPGLKRQASAIKAQRDAVKRSHADLKDSPSFAVDDWSKWQQRLPQPVQKMLANEMASLKRDLNLLSKENENLADAKAVVANLPGNSDVFAWQQWLNKYGHSDSSKRFRELLRKFIEAKKQRDMLFYESQRVDSALKATDQEPFVELAGESTESFENTVAEKARAFGIQMTHLDAVNPELISSRWLETINSAYSENAQFGQYVQRFEKRFMDELECRLEILDAHNFARPWLPEIYESSEIGRKTWSNLVRDKASESVLSFWGPIAEQHPGLYFYGYRWGLIQGICFATGVASAAVTINTVDLAIYFSIPPAVTMFVVAVVSSCGGALFIAMAKLFHRLLFNVYSDFVRSNVVSRFGTLARNWCDSISNHYAQQLKDLTQRIWRRVDGEVAHAENEANAILGNIREKCDDSVEAQTAAIAKIELRLGSRRKQIRQILESERTFCERTLASIRSASSKGGSTFSRWR
ncbi:MAG: hypothetical protein M5R36_05510 [Deltaproteobacteria bacterium]|nr:hypothetical protein [Deltaproteobacteria bacterium]